MPRRRLKPEERRAEIIEAAFRSFASQPYSEVSMAEIAEEAGASRALLTHYFGDKEKLYAAVIANLIEMLESMVRTDLGLTGRELINANMTSMLDLLIAQRESALALFSAGPAGPDLVIAGAVQDFHEHVVNRVLTNHFGDTEVPAGRRLAVLGFVGYASAVIFDWLKHEPVTREELHELLADNLEHSLAWNGT